jgi:hypothetical protein
VAEYFYRLTFARKRNASRRLDNPAQINKEEFPMKKIAFTFAAASALVLSACGGGGSGSTTTSASTAPLASVPLTVANYGAPAQAAVAPFFTLNSVSALETIASADQAGANRSFGLNLASITRYAAGLASLSISHDSPAASGTSSGACPYFGTASDTVTDTNNNDRLDAGDKVTADLSSCVVENGAPPISGGLDFTVVSATYNGNTLDTLTASAIFRTLGSTQTSLNGPADLTLGPRSEVITFHNVTGVHKNITATFNFTVSSDTSNFNAVVTLTGQMGYKGAAYVLSTTTPITVSTQRPLSGVLRVADSVGGYVVVTFRDFQTDLELYLPGDSTRDAITTIDTPSIGNSL